ncbi:MAG TPA: nucleotidyltransferase family protein [Acidobacteriota bacterium]|jgi:hypothetical protein
MDPGSAGWIKHLTQGPLDWGYLLRLAQHHGMMPLLYWHLSTLCPESVPRHALQALQDHFHINSRRNLLLLAELLEILRFFANNGIPAIPYKGPILAAYIYGNVSLRQFCDLDILVPKSQALKARDLLILRGYRPSIQLNLWQQAAFLDSRCEFCQAQADTNITVEVHWEIAPRYMVLPIDLQNLWRHLRPISFSAMTVLGFRPEDLLPILCLHGTIHRWERLEWICGISELVRRHPKIDWKGVLERAEILGGRRMLLLGLFLASDLLGSELPGEILNRIDADLVIKSLATKVRSQLFDPPDNRPDVFAMSFFHLSAKERLRDKIRYIFRLTTTPHAADWALLDLPEFLYFLYYLIRPIRLVVRYGAFLVAGLFTNIRRRDLARQGRNQDIRDTGTRRHGDAASMSTLELVKH